MKFKLVAIFLIVLVLGLPIYTSKVYADSLVSVSASGSDNVNGYRRKLDNANFEATIFSDDDPSGRVYLETADGTYKEAFDSCVGEVVGYKCIKSIEEQEWDPKRYDFPIKLYNQAMELMGTLYSSLVVDDTGAEVISFTANKNKVALEDTLTLNYNVQDSASVGSSGISKIDFYSDSVLVLSKEINTGSASSSGSFSVNVSELGSSGDVVLGLSAYDRLGQTGEMAEYMLNIDTSGPELIGEINLTKAGNKPVVYVPSNGVNAVLTIRVVAGDFKEARVKMIELNPSYYTYDEFMKGSCVELDDFYECSWEVNVKVEESVTANIYFELEDTTGNVNEIVKMYSLLVDDGPPSITNLETNFGSGWIGLETNFTAIISENGAGFNDANIYLNLASIGKGILQASSCNETAGGWRCNWDKIVSAENMANGIIPVNIMPSSMDDMGNYVTGKLGYNMTLDTKVPEINGDITVIPIMGSTGYPVNITEPKTGDSLVVLVNLTDETDVDGYGDFSKVLLFDDEYDVNCVGEGTDKMCVFETTQVREGPVMGTIDFRFTDGVGNVLEDEYDLIIYGVDNQTLVDKWYVSNEYNDDKMPNKVDAETTTLIEHTVYYPISLRRAVSGYIMPVDIYDLECFNGSNEFETPYIIGGSCNYANPEDSTSCTDFYVVVPLKLTNYSSTESLDCNFQIISLYGNVYERRLTSPEEVNLYLDIDFEGIALGNMGVELRKKLDDMESSGWIRGELIGPLEDIMDAFNVVCNLVSTLNSLTSAIDVTVALVSGSIPLSAGLEGGVTGMTAGVLKATGFMDKWFCSFVNCKPFFFLEDNNEGFWNAMKHMQLVASRWQSSMGLHGGEAGAGGQTPFRTQLSKLTNDGPKKSLLLSVATLCLPGVIENLARARQVDCRYIHCMENLVPLGQDVYACEYQRGYEWCSLVYGEIFQWIPFTQFAQAISDWFLSSADNLLSVAIGVVTGTCAVMSWVGDGSGAWCSSVQSYQKVMSMINDVVNVFDRDLNEHFDFSAGKIDYCGMLKDDGII